MEETAVSAAASDAVCQQQQQLQVPQSLQPCAQLTVFLLATTVSVLAAIQTIETRDFLGLQARNNEWERLKQVSCRPLFKINQ